MAVAWLLSGILLVALVPFAAWVAVLLRLDGHTWASVSAPLLLAGSETAGDAIPDVPPAPAAASTCDTVLHLPTVPEFSGVGGDGWLLTGPERTAA
jgi:hypothetical protein